MKRLHTFLAAGAVGVAAFAVIAQDAPRPQPRPGGPDGGAEQPPRNPGPDGQPNQGPRPGEPRNFGNPGNPDGPNGQRRPGRRPMASALFAALDTNHDGVIDETEIFQASQHLRVLDRNGDGQITQVEGGQRMGPGRIGSRDQARAGAPRGPEGGFGPEPRGPRPAGEPSREPNPGRERGPRRDGAFRPDGEPQFRPEGEPRAGAAPRREGGFGPEPRGQRPAGEPSREPNPAREGQPRPQNPPPRSENNN